MWITTSEQNYPSSTFQNYSEANLSSLKPIKIPALPNSYLTQNNLKKCLHQSTPILLTQPNWLQNTSMIAYSQSKIAMQLLTIYLQLTDSDKHDITPLNSYHSLLLSMGLKIPVLHDLSYNQQSNITPAMFGLATIQLALAHFLHRKE